MNHTSPSSSKRATDRFRSVATPTFDNRRPVRESFSELSRSPSKVSEKNPTERNTNVQVCVRLRPILPSDQHKQISKRSSQSINEIRGSSHSEHGNALNLVEVEKYPAWTILENTVTQSAHTNPDVNRKTAYAFDHSFGPEHSNFDIYDSTVRSAVVSSMEGYHSSVFAYGQTATGKTYTMSGDPRSDDDSSKGIIPLAIQDCFDFIYEQKDETREYLLRVSFMEIYNEVIIDLLAPPSNQKPMMVGTSNSNSHSIPPAPSSIRIFESKNEGVQIRGLKEEVVTSPEDVFELLAMGERRRQTGSTSMNRNSSRSHSIFRIIIESRKRLISQRSDLSGDMRGDSSVSESLASSTFAPSSSTGPVRVSTLSLVDLAGSESIRNTGSTGTRQKEGQYINKSLLTLGHVVYKLAEASLKSGMDKGGLDSTHIPVRLSFDYILKYIYSTPLLTLLQNTILVS